MKRSLLLLIILLAYVCMYSMTIPFSNVMVKTDANHITDYVRIEPNDKLPEPTPTNTWFWYDEDYLYARFESQMTPDFKFGNYQARDDGYDCDFVRIQLITIPEAFFAYFYVAMPNGSLWDGVRASNMNVDTQWNSTYSYETSIADSIWSVQMRIPLGELRFQQKSPYQWKVICTRYYGAEKEFYSAPYANTEDGLSYFTKAQDITLEHHIKKKLDLKFKPYFVKSYDLKNKTDSYDPENVGMDIAFNPGSRTRIKVTMNPDFSDLPMDNASDVYNSKYPQYFNENRFFFTEDIDALGVGSEVFYSRNIVQPQIAFKLTGNNKAVNYGALGAVDKEVKDGDDVITPNDYYQVLSIIPNWRKLYLRGSLVSRMNTGYYNHAFDNSFKWEFLDDLFLKLNSTLTLRKNDSESDDIQKGGMGNLILSYKPEHWDIDLYYSKITQDICLDAGYSYDDDFEKVGYSIDYSSETTKNYVKNFGANTWGEAYNRDLSSQVYRQYGAGASSWINLRPDFSFNCSGSFGSERGYDLRDYGYYYAYLSANMNKWDALGANLSLSTAKSLIYRLNDTSQNFTISTYLWGTLYKRVSYSISAATKYYDYEKETLVTQNGETELVVLDNIYQIINGSLTITANTKTRISNGLSMSTYASEGVYANMGFYSNLRYEFKPDCYFHMGYKTNQYQDGKPIYSDPLGHYVRSRASAYIKISVTL